MSKNGRRCARRTKKQKEAYALLITMLFMFAIGQIAIINIINKDQDVSVLENRKLEQKPQFSVTSLFNGEFTSKFETYVSDQFPARDFWLKMKSQLELMSGKNKINGVYIGKNNYYIEDFKSSSEQSLKDKKKAINDFAEKNSSLNTSFMLIPTATAIDSNELPENAPVDDEFKFINNVKSSLNDKIKFIDVSSVLKSHNKDKLYYRTDHHWTTKGAFLAYDEMCRQLNMKPYNNYDINTVTDDFYGSLYYKAAAGLGQPESIQIYVPKENQDVVVNYVYEKKKSASLYNSEKLKGRDKYEVFLNGNFPLINIKTDGNYDKKLLIIKDSYANSMIPFLTKNYGEIDVVDLRYYTDDVQQIIESNGITDVLFLFNVNTFNDDSSILNLDD